MPFGPVDRLHAAVGRNDHGYPDGSLKPHRARQIRVARGYPDEDLPGYLGLLCGGRNVYQNAYCKQGNNRDDCPQSHQFGHWMALPILENTVLAFDPIIRTVPNAMTSTTASMTAYSAMSCPSSQGHNC